MTRETTNLDEHIIAESLAEHAGGILDFGVPNSFLVRTDEHTAASQHACPFRNISQDSVGTYD